MLYKLIAVQLSEVLYHLKRAEFYPLLCQPWKLINSESCFFSSVPSIEMFPPENPSFPSHTSSTSTSHHRNPLWHSGPLPRGSCSSSYSLIEQPSQTTAGQSRDLPRPQRGARTYKNTESELFCHMYLSFVFCSCIYYLHYHGTRRSCIQVPSTALFGKKMYAASFHFSVHMSICVLLLLPDYCVSFLAHRERM